MKVLTRLSSPHNLKIQSVIRMQKLDKKSTVQHHMVCYPLANGRQQTTLIKAHTTICQNTPTDTISTQYTNFTCNLDI
jgi:hypothetical protein